DVPDDGGGPAHQRGRPRLPRQPDLAFAGLQHLARRVGRLLAPRPDPTLVLLRRWGGAAVLDCQPPGAGPVEGADGAARRRAGPGFDYTRVGVPANWPHHAAGFAAHWNKNSNLGAAFDQWFLNLFPRSKPFVANGGGYLTLSFIPTLATMLLGLIAGGWLHSALTPKQRVQRLVLAGVIGLA